VKKDDGRLALVDEYGHSSEGAAFETTTTRRPRLLHAMPTTTDQCRLEAFCGDVGLVRTIEDQLSIDHLAGPTANHAPQEPELGSIDEFRW
jgi:hypothetical protein